MTQLLLLLLLVPSILATPYPSPQDNDDTEVEDRYIYSTEKCDEPEFQAMTDNFTQCRADALDIISEALLFGNAFEDNNLYKKAVCEAWSGVLDCLKDAAVCFNDEELKIKKNNFMVDYFRRAAKDTDLGRNFVSSCPDLNEGRSELMEVLTGHDKCTFVEYDQSKDLYNACLDEVVEQRSNLAKRLDILGTRDRKVAFMSRIECNANTRIMSECVPLAQTCLDLEKRRELVQSWISDLDGRNQKLAADISGYEYESCGAFAVLRNLEE